jgi:DNA mismatch repair protein MutS
MSQPALSLPLDLPQSQTPMMQQYWALKKANPDCLLFFRMGDFYELFFEDAITAAPVLDVALTRRGKDDGEDVAMCGVPVHAYEAYIPKLIRAGFRVAIAEQMEDPETARRRAKETRGAKALVTRDIVRIITPGTLVEDSFIDGASANVLAVLTVAQGQMALAWCDLSDGQPMALTVTPDTLAHALARLTPAEIVLAEKMAEDEGLKPTLQLYREALTPLPKSRFDEGNARALAARHYGVASLDAFGDFTGVQEAALGVLIDYITLTQKQKVETLRPPRMASETSLLAMDAATRRNLELTQSLTGTRKGSLLAAIDRTQTHAGARLLAAWLASPLTDIAAIAARQEKIAALAADAKLRRTVTDILKGLPDLPRALARLSLKRGSPRDLAAVRVSLESAAEARFTLDQAGVFKADSAALGEHGALVEKLKTALREDLPHLARDGGFIAGGFSPALDELVSLRDDSKRLIAALQARYGQETKIPTLKIRHNNVIGYHVEVTPSQADKLLAPPFSAQFIHRQTMVSGVRFTTTELAELERKAAEAGGRALALELQLFEELVAAVMQRFEAVRGAAEALAQLDVCAGLAELAKAENWCRPQVDDSLAFHIARGRHPVVEQALRREGLASFIPNDAEMGTESRLWLVTGPNMAGKSTFLRQNAIIAVLAQMGSFVPAEAAHIGVIDRLFSRVGAADDLARGRSTFMVEMMETAAILNQATAKSFVILDEIGRGTATYDGLSIAWGALEYLYHQNQSRGLFATHYHELTALRGALPKMKCATATVREHEGEIIFLHEIREGVAESSYGIHVAELAGLPAPVIQRAQGILAQLEQKGSQKVAISPAGAEAFTAPVRRAPSAVEKALAAMNPDDLSPKEALEKLYALKKAL